MLQLTSLPKQRKTIAGYFACKKTKKPITEEHAQTTLGPETETLVWKKNKWGEVVRKEWIWALHF